MSADAGDALAAPAGRVRRAFDGAALRRWVRALLYELVHRPMTWVLAVLGLAGCAAETCGMLAMLGARHEVPVLPLKVLHPFAAVDGVTTAYAYFVGCLAIAVTAGPYRQGAAALRGVWAQDRRVCLLASVTAVLMASLVWTVAAAVVCWAVSLLPVVHAAGGPVISPAAAWARTAGPTLLLALMAVGIGWLTRATGRGVALWYAVMVLMHSVCLLLVGFGVAGVAVGALDPFLAVQRMGLAGAPVAVEVFPFPQWQYWVIAAGWLVVLAVAGGAPRAEGGPVSAADGPGGTTAGASLRRAVAADLYLWGRRRLLVALGAVGVAALLGLWAWALRAQTASGALAVSGRPGTGAVEGDFRAPLVLAAALVTTVVLVLRYAPRWHGGRADLMRLAGPGAAAGYLAQSLVCAIAAATAGAAATVGLHLEVMAIAPSAAAAGLGAAAAAAAVSCALLGLVCAGACAAARSTPVALTAVFALLAAGRVGGLLAGRLHGSAQALAVAWPFSALPAVNSADGTTPASGAAWAVLAAWAAAAWLIGLRRATAP